MVTAALLVPSATEVAVSVTLAGLGRAVGAVYVIAAPDALAEAEIMPQVAPVQPAPDSVQFTPLFVESFFTVGVKGLVSPTRIVQLAGETLTETPAAGAVAVTVIAAAAVFVPSVTEVAVNVTRAGFGTLAGAVYVSAAPDALLAADNVPQVVPLQPLPAKAQVTPWVPLSFNTVAVKTCVRPACTDTVAGDTATETAPTMGVPPPL